MSNEIGGRADKFGNRFEKNCIINCFLDVISEKIISCSIENIGEDEEGTDIIVVDKNQNKKYIQCKERNENNNGWTFSSLNKYGLFDKWRKHLEKAQNYIVSLQSPLTFVELEDLIKRANNTTENAEDFYKIQINSSGRSTINSYNKYCKNMKLDISQKNDINKSIDFLRRTKIEQRIDENFKNELLERINVYFIGESNQIYNLFLDLIENGNIFAKKIDINFLNEYLNKNNIIKRDLSNDGRIFPTIERLNIEYKNSFIPINNNSFKRKELEKCIEEIEKGNSIIIHGKAGFGKSGITNNLIEYFEKNKTTYLAIKLDKKIPKGNSEFWSKELGFTTFFTYSLNAALGDERGVLILDQLDALRWTQSHSKDSIDVCCQILKEIEKINKERENKISIVLVCRTYDLENDTGIKKIVDLREQDNVVKWLKIKVDALDDEQVKNIVGKKYEKFNLKLKKLLKIPSNLFIWTKLKEYESYDNIFSTGSLINKWWKKIENDCTKFNINTVSLKEARNEIINTMKRNNKISISDRHLNIENNVLEFLHSQELIIRLENGLISFSHQSILDYYLVEEMLEKYLNGTNLIELIGEKDKQTPTKRYQLQMFLQELIFEDISKFVEAIKEIIENEKIRSYIRYVAFEVLGQVAEIDTTISSFIIENCEKEVFTYDFLYIVFMGHRVHIKHLIEKGVFDKWIIDNKKKELVISLLRSINDEFGSVEEEFLNNYLNKNSELDNLIYKCFPIDVEKDTEAIFGMRLNLYKKYKNLSDIYVNLDRLIKTNEKRAVTLIKFWIEYDVDKKRHVKYSESSIEYNENDKIKGDEEVVVELLPVIPRLNYKKSDLYSWEEKNYSGKTIERICMLVIKDATTNLIKKDPNKFFEIYQEFMGKGFALHNEIILTAINSISSEYNEFVIKYLFSNIDNNIFEYTSGSDSKITLAQEIFSKRISYIEKNIYSEIEEKIIGYKSPDMIDTYKRIIELRKYGHIIDCYFSFWGDFQIEFLRLIPKEIMSENAKSLLNVLERKFNNKRSTKYRNYYAKLESVNSPLDNKKISDKQWKKIISNKKNIRDEDNVHRTIELAEISSSFSKAIEKSPERFINLIIDNRNVVLKPYIETLYYTLAYTNEINYISSQLLEKMFDALPYNKNYILAKYILRIIARKKDSDWSDRIIKLLKDIFEDIKSQKIPNGVVFDDKEERDLADAIEIYIINSAIGEYAEAISNLLSEKKELYKEFEEIITDMRNSEDIFSNYAVLEILYSCLNIKKEDTLIRFVELFEKRNELLGFRRIHSILYYCYKEKDELREKIIKIIRKGLKSSSDRVKTLISYVLTEIFINYNELPEYFENIPNDSIIKKSILEMLIEYFDVKERKEKAKENIIRLIDSGQIDEIYVYKIFNSKNIDLKKDKEFLLKLCESKERKRFIRAFVNYIENNALTLLEYKDFIFTLSEKCIEQITDKDYEYGYDIEDLIKIVVKLFDEVNELDSENETKLKCMDIWDKMFEKHIGTIRDISRIISDL